jgi:hypothetical protein
MNSARLGGQPHPPAGARSGSSLNANRRVVLPVGTVERTAGVG